MQKWNFYTTKEIKPTGWLYRQLKLQANGLSGHLDKMWPDIRDSAWIGGEREGWERVPYWLDGFIPLAYLLEDEDMICRAKKYMDAIIERQQPNGWICPCREDEREKYDTWAIQLITKVLTVFYQCSGDERIPNVIYKILKNYYGLLKSGKIQLFTWGKFRWFELFISLNFIYSKYPEAWLVDLAQIVKSQGANYEEFIPQWKRPLNKWALETHIVNLCMMLKAEAVSCDLLGENYTDTAQRLYDVLKQYNGTAVETFTGDECLSGISPIQGTELCAVVEQMYSYELLYAYTGDPKWAERLEILAFNALPATISEDMWTHQYVQMNNQIACQKFPGKSLFRTNNSEAHLFGLEPHFGCCTANFNQGWPKFALSAFMYSGHSVVSVLPIPCQLKTQDIFISLETNYPFENTLKYTVEAKKDFQFEIRLPQNAENIMLNGEKQSETHLVFAIRKGEKRELAIRFTFPAHFEKFSYGLNYAKCGSLVFSLPIAAERIIHEYVQNGVERKFPYCDYELLPKSDWNYAFADSSLKVEPKTVSAVPFSETDPPIVAKVKMQKIHWGFADGYENVCAKKPQSLTPISDTEELTLIPYGCAKLRMTLMPFVK